MEDLKAKLLDELNEGCEYNNSPWNYEDVDIYKSGLFYHFDYTHSCYFIDGVDGVNCANCYEIIRRFKDVDLYELNREEFMNMEFNEENFRWLCGLVFDQIYNKN